MSARLVVTLTAFNWLTVYSIVLAVDRSWVSPGGGIYNSTINWSGNVVPTAADNGIFNLNTAGYVVTFNAGTTSGGMIVRNDIVTLNLSGFTLTLASAAPGLTVADGGGLSARLTIQNGTLATNSVTLASNSTTIAAIGAATVTTGGTLSVSSLLNVASTGFASLNVFSGGRLTTGSSQVGVNATATGSITVSGAGSSWVSTAAPIVGNAGAGNVRLLSGGTASWQGMILGAGAGATGTLQLSGATTVGTSSLGMTVGQFGSGTVTVSGAQLTGASFSLADQPGSSGFVGVSSNGTWTSSASVRVGVSGSGYVEILGGRASCSQLILGSNNPAASGRVVIAFGGGWSVTGDTVVGGQGTGDMLLAAGGTLSTGSATIGNATSGGFVTVSGASTFTCNQLLSVGENGNGTVILDAGGRLNCGSVILGQGVNGSGTCIVSGNGSRLSSTDVAIVGAAGAGIVSVNTNADVNSAALTLGEAHSGNGAVTINGTGSSWTAAALTVGSLGVGALQVTSGGSLSSDSAQIGARLGSTGSVYVGGNGARWACTGNIFVGGDSISSGGSGSLEIGSGGNVFASSLLRLYSSGVVNLNGGTLSVGSLENQGGQFNFNSGTLNITSFFSGLVIDGLGPFGSNLELRSNQYLGVNGTLSVGFNGQLTINGGRVTAAFLSNISDVVLQSPTSHLTATVFNAGQLRGTGSIFGNVNNNTNGQIRALSGETLRIVGALTNNSGGRIDLPGGILQSGALENFGQIFLDGGALDVSSPLVNRSGGRINGRGRIISNGNFDNSGTLNLTSGITDIEGASGIFNNNASGRVIITGNSTTNFFKPVNNAAGSEMRVSSGATAVYFEPVSGLGAFTGSGTVIFESTAGFGSINRIGTTVVGASGLLSAGHVRENILEVNGRADVLPNGTTVGTSRVQRLLIAGELTPVARLDLADNDLVIDYSGPSPLLTIAAQLKSGYAAGAWTGVGISSSAAAGVTGFALGFAESADLFSSFPAVFSGQTIDNTAVLIAYTRYGDANLDGAVNLADFNRLAANFGMSSGIWSKGDFNFDGAVNLSDFNALAGNFGLSASADGPTAQDWSALASVVPEPAAPALLGLVAGATAAYRRRGSR